MKLKDLLNSKALDGYKIKVYDNYSEEIDISDLTKAFDIESINITVSTKTAFVKLKGLDYFYELEL